METGYSHQLSCCEEIGLNRTMQYGNLSPLSKATISYKFKSYYVVWKLFRFIFYCFCYVCLNRTMQYGNLFKEFRINVSANSLNRTMQYGNSFIFVFGYFQFTEFKSYYVVWKPPGAICIACSMICLNRTMQYGNLLHCTVPAQSFQV